MLELNTLSLSELKDLLRDIEREIKRRQNAEKAKAAQQVRDIMATYGLTSEEVLSGKTNKGSRAVTEKTEITLGLEWSSDPSGA